MADAEVASTRRFVSMPGVERIPFPDLKATPISLVDALLRLGGLDEQVDELVREPRSTGQRLHVGAAHGSLAPRIEHRPPGLALRLSDDAGHLQAPSHQRSEVVIDGVHPRA